MNKLSITALILSLALLLGVPMTGYVDSQSSVKADVSVNFGFFQNSLSPYGHWVNTSNYGPCWRPANLASGWQPYVDDGHWAYTEYGWTWVSDDPWAPITYHYGSWYDDPSYGWMWVPGYVWGPSWVTWSYTDDYVGWAPLPPSYQFYANQSYAPAPVINNVYYVYVPAQNFTDTRIRNIMLPRDRNAQIWRRAHRVTTLQVNNYQIINNGPNIPRLAQFRRSRQSINQISQGRIQPRRVSFNREARNIELSSPRINRQEAPRVIKDFDRQQREARADRLRQLQRPQLPGNDIRNVREQNRQQQLDQNAAEKARQQQQQQTQRELQKSRRDQQLQQIQQQRQQKKEAQLQQLQQKQQQRQQVQQQQQQLRQQQQELRKQQQAQKRGQSQQLEQQRQQQLQQKQQIRQQQQQDRRQQMMQQREQQHQQMQQQRQQVQPQQRQQIQQQQLQDRQQIRQQQQQQVQQQQMQQRQQLQQQRQQVQQQRQQVQQQPQMQQRPQVQQQRQQIQRQAAPPQPAPPHHR